MARRAPLPRAAAAAALAVLTAGCSFGGGSETDETAAEAETPAPAESTIPAATVPPEPDHTEPAAVPDAANVPAGHYAWCPKWADVKSAAAAYDAEAARAQTAIEAIAHALVASPLEPGDTASDAGPPDVAKGVAEALVVYGSASSLAAAAAENAYRAAAGARDAAHTERNTAYRDRTRALSRDDLAAYDAAMVRYTAADAAVRAAEAAASDLDLAGDLTIGSSGWQDNQYVDWPRGWPKPVSPGLFDAVSAMCGNA